MSENKEEDELDKLLDAVNSILGIKESWYKCIFVVTKDQEVDDFTMPNGIGLLGKGKTKSMIFVDNQIWTDYEEATDEDKKRRRFAKVARIFSHELMHLHQLKYSYDKYKKDFVYESKLPKNTSKWTVSQRKKYDNLSIELEAIAFSTLVESAILHRRRLSSLHTYTNRYQYNKIYSQIKNVYVKRIEKLISNLPL